MKIVTLFYLVIGLFVSSHAAADITVTDIAGRTVSIEQPAKQVVLGEGRFVALLGVLGIEQPISYIAGMMNEFKTFDPATYAHYQAAYPEIDQVPTFGHTSEESVNVEQIILLNPDLAIFGLNGHGPGKQSKHIISKLEAAGIPVVFIDFRQDPLNNTVQSVEIIGKLIGKEQAAQQFSRFYKTELEKVTQRVATLEDSDYASVLFELKASIDQPCCLSVAKGLFADMAKVAGGVSIADGVLPGPVGQLNFEHVIEAEFDVYIGSAIGAMSDISNGKSPRRLILGAGVSEDSAQYALSELMQRKGFTHLTAVRNHRAHAIWHHFYNSPLNIYAIQKMATWFHPELFQDLDPELTLNTLLTGFKRVDLSGTYAVSN